MNCCVFDQDMKTEEMLFMQEDLNQETFRIHGTSYNELLENDEIFYAILDELGEWNHERKSNWCWWKKTQKEADRQRELEEFADIMHFVFTYALAMENGNFKKALSNAIHSQNSMKKAGFLEKQPLHWKISYLLDCVSRTEVDDIAIWSKDVIPVMFAIAEDCGYSFDEIFTAYVRKNTKNHERLRKGY